MNRPSRTWAACWARSSCMLALACAVAAAQAMTLDEVLARAEAVHPSLRIARADADAAVREAREADAPQWNNPQLSTELRQRRLGQADGGDVSRRDAAVGISQTFETGGQPTARREAARATVAATRANAEAARRELRAQAARRFHQALLLRERVRIEEEALALLDRAAGLVRKRVAAGEDSRLDGNSASLEAERSSNQLAQSRIQLAQAMAELANLLRLPRDAQPTLDADLSVGQVPYTLEVLLDLLERSPRLAAITAQEQAAGKRLALERAARSPDVTVGLSYSPERGADTRDRVTTLSLSLPLPLFRRNDGAIGRAASDLERARLERETAVREADVNVRLLWQQQLDLAARVGRLRSAVLPMVEESQMLSLKALQAGEIGLGQYLLVRRQTLDARRDLLDAIAELTQTRVDLEAAAGWPEHLPPLTGDLAGNSP